MKEFQAIRIFKKGMVRTIPLGYSFQATSRSQALKLSRSRYMRIPGSKIDVWEKQNL